MEIDKLKESLATVQQAYVLVKDHVMDLQVGVDLLRDHLNTREEERERERIVINLTGEVSPVPPGGIPGMLVPNEESAHTLSNFGALFATILHLLIIFLFIHFGPVGAGWQARREALRSQSEEFRDFQVEVDAQRREPYQNADVIADQFVADGLALPPYDPPPYEE